METMRAIAITGAALLAPAWAMPAAAAEGQAEGKAEGKAGVEPAYHADDARLGLVLGLKAGGGLGLGALGATPVFELEIGYTLPVALPEARALQVFVAGQYAMPATEGNAGEADARLPGDGQMRYVIEQQQAIVTMGVLYRIRVPTTWIRPYVALAGRVWLIESTIEGRAGGEGYGIHTEQDTEWGGYGAVGVDVYLGPGAALFEVQGVYGKLDGFVLRDTHLGGVNAAVGYRVML